MHHPFRLHLLLRAVVPGLWTCVCRHRQCQSSGGYSSKSLYNPSRWLMIFGEYFPTAKP